MKKIWVVSKTIKLNPLVSEELIRALRIRDKKLIIILLGGTAMLPGWYGKLTSLIMALGLVELDEFADSIEKALRRSPSLGTRIKFGILLKFSNQFHIEAKPRYN